MEIKQMKIAILGGTGKMGEGFTCRWAYNHEIYIGSRSIEKANEAANNYIQKLICTVKNTDISKNADKRYNIRGMDNKSAAEIADIIVLAVPYDAALELIKCLEPVLKNQIIISIVVPMKKAKQLEYSPPTEGCGASSIKSLVSCPTVKIVSAYHNISFNKLCNIDSCIECDTIICSDDIDAKKTVMDLTLEIPNLRPLDGGSLCESRTIELLTPFLINMAKRNGLSDLGIKFV